MLAEIKIVVHHATDDPKCLYDYLSVSVMLDGVELRRYGDYYHDKGREKAEGFIDGYLWNSAPDFITQRGVTERVADEEPF